MSEGRVDTLAVVGAIGPEPTKADLAALGCAVRAAALAGGAFDVLAVGPQAAAVGGALRDRGAGRVITVSHPDLDPYTAEAWSEALVALLTERPHRLIVASTSSIWRETLPRVAARLGAPMASDIVSVDESTAELLRCERPVFVGNLLAAVELRGPQALATCRASAFEAPASGGDASVLEDWTPPQAPGHPRKRVLESRRAESERPDLREAEIVVGVGRGTGSPEKGGPGKGVALCEELADLLGAAIGGTRAVVDAGWLPNELQVGQTGKVVAPKLYIAVGLSGSIQHIAGMRGSKAVVAINKDPEAPIFEIADVGLVADLFEAVPALTNALREARAE